MVPVTKITDMQKVLKRNFDSFVRDYENNKKSSNIFFKVYKEDGIDVPVYVEYSTKVIKYDRWIG